MRTPYQIVADHYAASDRRDPAAMMADIAPTIAWTEMAGFPCAGTYHSKEEIVRNVFERLGNDWDNYTFKLDALHDAGDTVIGIGRYSGTYKQTGKSFECRVAHVWRVEAGQIVGFEQFTDTLLVAQAMQR
ncbi:DUF4440 domain-containing protein [Burkholderia singularis]|uniref:DUF4440 domain-containing protein n=1 Tax=Burkholderia singularis TaxID=1503053 RepID=A0A103E1J5_9BURK|nr:MULTISPECIES: nuclear transport factor 2 family protein [Burkholderia]AOK28278.1 DUF4440 domain-containing protein [Burkholderia sp. Bp7605]KVE26645.1 DUF4440 domain-containing protein [Burkholderia singularis]